MQARISTAVAAEGAGLDAAGAVHQLEQELEAVRQRNKKLEQRCGGLEADLRDALGHADDLVLLKSKALTLLVS